MQPLVLHAAVIKGRERNCFRNTKAAKERVDPPTDLLAKLTESAAFTVGITIQPHFPLNPVISQGVRGHRTSSVSLLHVNTATC